MAGAGITRKPDQVVGCQDAHRRRLHVLLFSNHVSCWLRRTVNPVQQMGTEMDFPGFGSPLQPLNGSPLQFKRTPMADTPDAGKRCACGVLADGLIARCAAMPCADGAAAHVHSWLPRRAQRPTRRSRRSSTQWIGVDRHAGSQAGCSPPARTQPSAVRRPPCPCRADCRAKTIRRTAPPPPPPPPASG